jgi:hemolysin activation/secretion protein
LISPTPWRQGAIALAAACLAASQSAHGQTSAGTPLSPVYPGRVLETLAAKATPADAERHAAGTNRPDGAGGGAGDDGATLLVTGFRITGNTVFAEGELQPLLAPWVGKRLGTDALLDAAQALRGRYQDAGYFLTQVFVPAQRPEGGIVTLRVVEARLGKARTQVDSQRVDAARVEGYMRLLPEGSAITEQDVERPLLLISDLPGVQLESTLSPGAAPGEADLLVTVKDSPHAIKGDMYVDNQGTSQTGRIRVGADLGLEGPAGLGEAWWLGGIASEGGGVKAVRAAVTLPVGDHGTKATLSLAHVEYRVLGSQYAALDANGRADVGSLDLRHPLARSRNMNLFVNMSAAVLDVDDRELGGTLDAHRVLPVLSVGVNGDFRDERWSGSVNTYSLNLAGGHSDIRNASQLAADQAATGHGTSGTFGRLEGDFQRLQALTATTSLLASLRGQLAFGNLDASQKSSLGGPTGVRAFATGDGVGDDAFLGTLEIRQGFPSWTLWNAPVLLSAFVDGGRVRVWHNPTALDTDNLTTLGGYGLGLNLSHRDDFQFRMDVAHKINQHVSFQSDSGRTHLWASITKSFR